MGHTVVAVGLWLGTGSTTFATGLFFSKAALVTVGGAYAVLPYVADQAVMHHAWLQPEQMMAGLGLAGVGGGPGGRRARPAGAGHILLRRGAAGTRAGSDRARFQACCFNHSTREAAAGDWPSTLASFDNAGARV